MVRPIMIRFNFPLFNAGIWLLMLLSILIGEASSQAGPVAQIAGVQVLVPAAQNTLPPTVSRDWLQDAERKISAMEYQVTWQDGAGALNQPSWQATNRAQNLRTYFTPDGIRITPRKTTALHDVEASSKKTENSDKAQPWILDMNLMAWGRPDQMESLPVPLSVQKTNDAAEANQIKYQHGPIAEWYVNDERGLKQNFQIVSPPSNGAEGMLFLELRLHTALKPSLSPNGKCIALADESGKVVARYAGLSVEDALRRNLPATMILAVGEKPDLWKIQIQIQDEGASYPISIDPLFTGAADATIESNQNSALMGYSVAGAGDVNGDGYGDVIIGAHFYDNGQTDEGAAFIFLGGPSGIASGSPSSAAAILESNQTGARMGIAVAGAGDINGDGYADVIVGAPFYDKGQANEGAAFIFLGGPSGIASGSPLTAATTLESDQADAHLGYSVAGAGDVNGDGYSDVIVGAFSYDNGQNDEGAAFIFLGTSSGIVSGNPSTAATTLESNQADARMGHCVAGAGDVNGDGYADVIVDAYQYDNGQTDEGTAFIFLGSSTGVASSDPSTAATTLESNQTSSFLGYSVAGAGDVNGDGYSDVIVGAYQYDNGQTDEGAAFIFLGSSTGVASGNPSTAATTLESNQVSAFLGFSVAAAGDVNGDGYADVIVGAYQYDNGQTDEGAAFIFPGGPTGVASANPSTASATLESNQASANLGYCVAGAGDVNGDGIADVIVSAPLYDNVQTDEGAAFIYLGAASAIASTSPSSAESNQANALLGFSVAGAGDINGDGCADFVAGVPLYDKGQTNEGVVFIFLGAASGGLTFGGTIESNQVNAQMGYSVAGAGDVNGDGYADIMVGAPFYDKGQTDEGAAFIFLGGPSGISSGSPGTAATTFESDQAGAQMGYSVSGAGDVNGDGYADVIIGAPYFNNPEADEGAAFVYLGSPGSMIFNALFQSDQAGALFGLSVAGAGDVNADGYADVVIGAPHYVLDTNTGLWDGEALVFSGSPSGMTSGTPGSAFSVLAPTLNSGAQVGWSVSSAGDINGDGYADVIVGAPYGSNGQSQEGQAYVYRGNVNAMQTGSYTTLESDQASAYMGWSVAGAGDVNGDGYGDLIIGAYQYDNGQTDEGAAILYLGSTTMGTSASSGNLTNAAAIMEGNQAGARMGYSVASVGDLGGDGYADVIVGASQFDNGQSDEGVMFLFRGNRKNGLSFTPRQRRADDSAPIAIGLGSDSINSFRLAARGTTPYGRGKVKLQWENKPLGTPFNGAGLQQSTSWVDTGTAGAALNELVTTLTAQTLYHWRLRVLYQPQIAPFTFARRWMNQFSDGWQLADVRTKGIAPNAIGIVPDPAGPTNVDNLNFTVTFDKPVQNFNNANDLIITHGGTSNTSISISGGPTSYVVTVTGISGDGSFTMAVKTAGQGSDVMDFAGQGLASSITSAAVLIDNTAAAPLTPDLINASDTGISNSDNITNDDTPTFSGTVEANATVNLYVDGSLEGNTSADSFGVWSITTGALSPGTRNVNTDQTDPAGNTSVLSDNLVITIDVSAPTIANENPGAGSTVVGLPSVGVSFNEDVFNVAATDLTISGSQATNLTGSDSGPYAFTGYAAPANGTVNAVLGSGLITDAAGNPFAGSNWTYTKNSNAVAVALSSNDVANGGNTNLGSLAFTATFSEGVSGFDATDVSVTSGSLNSFSQVNPSTYTFNIVPAGTTVTVQIATGVANAVSPPNNPNATSLPYIFSYDTAAPSAVSITPNTAGPTNATSISFAVAFSEDVVNFDAASDLVITHTGTSNIGVMISGGPRNYTVDVNGITGDGNFTLAVKTAAAGSDVQDLAGNVLASSVTSAGVQIDNTAPNVITIVPSTTGPTQATSVNFAISFDSPEQNFNDIADLVISENGVTHSGVIITGGLQNYLVTVNGISGTGSIMLAVKTASDGSDVLDLAGNGLASSVTSAVVQIDNTAPAAMTITPSTTGPTNATSISFAVAFGEDVVNFDAAADLEITHSGTANTGVAIFGGPRNFTVNVNGITGDGSFTLAVKTNAAGSNIQDLAGNGLASSVTSAVVNIDNTAPTVTISSAVAPGPTNINPIPVTITFSEPMSGSNLFTLSDIQLTNGTPQNFQTSDSQTFTFEVFPSDNPTTISINVAAGVARDAAGNDNQVATPFSIDYISSRPTVTLSSNAPDPTNANFILVTAAFSENVTGFNPMTQPGDLLLVNATVTNFVPISGSTYTIQITPNGDGLFSVQVPGGAAIDAATNPNDPSNVLQRTSDRTIPTIDSIVPSVIGSTNADTITFTVVFSEPISDFNDVSDVVVNTSGTVANTSVTIAPSTGFTATVSGITGDGTISLSIVAGAVRDAANNANDAAGPSATIVIDNTPPVASAPTDTGANTTNQLVTFNWAAPTDESSGIAKVILQVGTSPGSSDVYNAIVSENSAQVGGTVGQTLYAHLIVTDNAGNQTVTQSSDGILILPSTGNNAAIGWEIYN